MPCALGADEAQEAARRRPVGYSRWAARAHRVMPAIPRSRRPARGPRARRPGPGRRSGGRRSAAGRARSLGCRAAARAAPRHPPRRPRPCQPASATWSRRCSSVRRRSPATTPLAVEDLAALRRDDVAWSAVGRGRRTRVPARRSPAGRPAGPRTRPARTRQARATAIWRLPGGGDSAALTPRSRRTCRTRGSRSPRDTVGTGRSDASRPRRARRTPTAGRRPLIRGTRPGALPRRLT